MSTRKTVTSDSGARMSQYDQEVERRLQALESKAHVPCGGGSSDNDRLAALEARLDLVVEALKQAAPGAATKL